MANSAAILQPQESLKLENELCVLLQLSFVIEEGDRGSKFAGGM
jgi:hypothetical protein